MKNRSNKLANLIQLPEDKIPRIWAKLMNRVNHLSRAYWIATLIVILGGILFFLPSNVRKVYWIGITNKGKLVVMMLIFCLLALSLVWSAGQRADVWILKLFNMLGHRPLWLDWFMLAFTQVGNAFFTIGIAIILYIGVDHLFAYELILGTLQLWLVVELMKLLIHRIRPYIKLEDVRIVGAHAGGRSFPSGHTSQAFFVATLLSQYFHTGFLLGLVLYCIAGIVGITRMYVGMHYPRDVVAGAILGTVGGSIGAILIFL